MSIVGKLLTSTPKLKDPTFLKSVILLIKEDANFKIGVVINQTQKKLIKLKDLQTDKYLKFGGPIIGPIIAIHNDERFAESEITPNLYYSCEYNNINEIISNKNNLYQLYSGYSCWAAGQLENEISYGYWTLGDLDSSKILHEEDEFIWIHQRHKYGKDYLNYLGINQYFNYALN